MRVRDPQGASRSGDRCRGRGALHVREARSRRTAALQSEGTEVSRSGGDLDREARLLASSRATVRRRRRGVGHVASRLQPFDAAVHVPRTDGRGDAPKKVQGGCGRAVSGRRSGAPSSGARASSGSSPALPPPSSGSRGSARARRGSAPPPGRPEAARRRRRNRDASPSRPQRAAGAAGTTLSGERISGGRSSSCTVWPRADRDGVLERVLQLADVSRPRGSARERRACRARAARRGPRGRRCARGGSWAMSSTSSDRSRSGGTWIGTTRRR